MSWYWPRVDPFMYQLGQTQVVISLRSMRAKSTPVENRNSAGDIYMYIYLRQYLPCVAAFVYQLGQTKMVISLRSMNSNSTPAKFGSEKKRKEKKNSCHGQKLNFGKRHGDGHCCLFDLEGYIGKPIRSTQPQTLSKTYLLQKGHSSLEKRTIWETMLDHRGHTTQNHLSRSRREARWQLTILLV
mgnify:CR=1 FL=1